MSTETPAPDVCERFSSERELGAELTRMATDTLTYRIGTSSRHDRGVFDVSKLYRDISKLLLDVVEIMHLREQIDNVPTRSIKGLAEAEDVSITAIRKKLRKFGIEPDDLRNPAVPDIAVIMTSSIRERLEDVVTRFSTLKSRL